MCCAADRKDEENIPRGEPTPERLVPVRAAVNRLSPAPGFPGREAVSCLLQLVLDDNRPHFV